MSDSYYSIQKEAVLRLEAAIPDLIQAMKLAKSPSIPVGVIHEGEVIFRKSIGIRDLKRNLEANSDTSYLIASCSKMITSMALGLLEAEKKLTMDDSIRTHLPSFDPVEDPEIGANATLSDACRHSTGLASPNVVYMGPDGIIANTAKDHIAMVNALPTSNHTGQRFHRWWYYSNATFGLLPQVIEAVSGSNFADFIKERLLEPLGMDQTLLHDIDVQENGNVAHPYAPQTDGSWAKIETRVTSETHSPVLGTQGIRSSVNDILSFFAAVMNKYDQENEKASPQPLLSAAKHNPLGGVTTMWDSWWTRPIDDGFENQTAYTLGWYRTTLPTSALGLLGMNKYADPEESNMKEILGRDSTPRTLYGHDGNANGSTSAAYLFPESHTAVVALSNASFACDAAEAAARILIQAIFDLKPHVDIVSALSDARERGRKEREAKVAEWETHRKAARYTGSPEDFVGTYIGLNTSRIHIHTSNEAPAHLAVGFGENTTGICDLEPYDADTLSFFPTDDDAFLARGMLDWDFYTVGIFEFVRDEDRDVIAFWWQWEETDWPGLWVRQKEGMSQEDVQAVIEKLGRFRKLEKTEIGRD